MSEGFTDKQRVFIEEYLTCWNATEAARRAEYAHPNKQGPENLVKPGIQAEIQRRISEKAMSADEVLLRLAAMARGSIADVTRLPDLQEVTEKKKVIDDWAIDLVKAQKTGAIHLIKKIKSGLHGPEIEMYDAQAALALLGKHHGLFVDRQEIEQRITFPDFDIALDKAYDASDDNAA